ncbi:Opy1p LALA0_S03e05622g [Lachancea lanzarotensis]|uniref:LALA0S03e05622g1_1 n=1 Tax=Lachancea lanzarotensis TaxID=1245769 RepID=A0A0C7N4P4_9SACH|nr:uncharacterized protein LALA0_S03e05622g [Lachancea lanzarotensis]CEP61561.1 LALA0S03e05622g1_1 [Lachancea lanzarotensis]
MADHDTRLLYTATEHLNDVLVSSFLFKRSYGTSGKIAVQEPVNLGSESTNGHHGKAVVTTQHKFNKSKYHEYWCVLRRGQFSYYKDKSERKAIDVIPAEEILGFRPNEKELLFDFYTIRKTYYLRADSPKVFKDWDYALKEFFADRRLHATSKMELLLEHTTKGESKPRVLEAGDHDEEDENDDEHDENDENDENDDENDENDENDDDFQILSEARQPSPTTYIRRSPSRSVPVPDEDREFYAIFSPTQVPPRSIQKGVLYCRIKKRLGRRAWKKVSATLDSSSLYISSISSGKLYWRIHLDKVVDAIEDEKNRRCFTGFAIITFDERLKFRAMSEQESIDWIMNLKSCVVARRKLEQLDPLATS